MRNPLDIEQQYQNLLFALSQPAVSWQRAMSVIGFLDKLLPDAARSESYVLDALDHLYPVLKTPEPSSLSPDELHHPLKVLDQIRAAIPELNNDERFTGATDSLRVALCHTLVSVGDFRGLVAALNPGAGTTTPDWLEQMSRVPQRDRRAALQYVASHLPLTDAFTATCVRTLLTLWEESTAGDADAVRVPVVERGFGNLSVESRGVLRRVTLRITGIGTDEKDRLETAIAVYGAETIGHSLVEAPLAAARGLLDANVPALRSRTLTGVVTLDQHPALHEGDSAGLAIATLYYAAALRYTNQRVLFSVRSDVAMTGVIDPGGNVLPVDPASLVPKTRAVFFSRIDTLVVPKEQLGPVEEEVARLTARYPGRYLEVVGVSHLREVFFDLRIIRQQVVLRSIHLFRRVWKRRAVLAPLAVAGAAILLLVKLLVGPLDRNPVAVAYVGESLVLKNRFEDTLASLRVGPATCAHARIVGAGYQLSSAACLDADRDGTNDVIFIEKAWEGTAGIELLRCWSEARKAFLWQLRRSRSYTFPEKPEAGGVNYKFLGFRLGDFDADGRRDLLLAANHSPSFPGVLTLIDPADGSERSEYFHAGNIMDLIPADVDTDGVDEIVVCAINNAYNRAVLFCLEGGKITGHSPNLPAYQPEGVAAAEELCYVLIPRTVVGETFRSERDNNSAQAVSVESVNREISLSVDDGTGDGPATILNFTFDFDFRIRHIAPGDTYDALAAELVRKGTLREVPDVRYFERLQRSLRYWTGRGWSESGPGISTVTAPAASQAAVPGASFHHP